MVTSKPLPGERKILPQRAVPVCPACKGALATNIHWSEGVLGCAAALLAFLVQQLLSKAVQPGAGFFALMGAVGAAMVALMVFSISATGGIGKGTSPTCPRNFAVRQACAEGMLGRAKVAKKIPHTSRWAGFLIQIGRYRAFIKR